MPAAFQFPEPLKGHLKIGDDRHAKHAPARGFRILRTSCKDGRVNSPAKNPASHTLIGYMDKSRHLSEASQVRSRGRSRARKPAIDLRRISVAGNPEKELQPFDGTEEIASDRCDSLAAPQLRFDFRG
jgi:hypothetical protein